MKCIETFDGKEFWIDDAKAESLAQTLSLSNAPKMVKIGDTLINTNHIAGIYDEIDMKEKEYRKQGQYICEMMRWHQFKEECNCRSNYMKYKTFGTAPKSKQCLEFEKRHGDLELNLDENYHVKTLSTLSDKDLKLTDKESNN